MDPKESAKQPPAKASKDAAVKSLFGILPAGSNIGVDLKERG